MDLGCGLFGLATELDKDFTGVMAGLAESGFTAVEPLFAFKNDPALAPDSPVPSFLKTILWDEKRVVELLSQLKGWGLAISSMHVGFLFGADADTVLPELISFAERTGICHFMTSMEFDTMEKCQAAIKLLTHTNEVLNPYGVDIGYHNHYMECKKICIEGKETTLLEYFLNNTPDSVKLQLDTGWQMYGGDDVIAFMRKYPDRIASVHLKDFVPEYSDIDEEDAFAAIGEGCLPIKGILSELPTLAMIPHGLMIDQDKAARGHLLADDLRVGAANLKKMIG